MEKSKQTFWPIQYIIMERHLMTLAMFFEALSEWERWQVIRVGCERSPGMGKERRKGGRKTSLEEVLRPKGKSEEGLWGQGRR